MQRLLYIIFISFFLVVSCAKQKPKGIVSESKMTDLLTEVSLIDSYLNLLPIDSGRKVMPVLYDNLFKQFDIDSLQFKHNLDYYYGNPILTESIYKKIDSRLKVYQDKYRIEDSIRNAFVSDSIRRVSKIQQLVQDRHNLTLNYYKHDTETYNYRDYAFDLFRKLDLGIMAYGVHIPAISTTNNIIIPEEPIMQDSVLRKYLYTPINKFLFVSKGDSSSIDFRIQNVIFLKNSGLSVRTGYTYSPKIKNMVDTTSSAVLDSLSDTTVDSTTVRLENPQSEVDPKISSRLHPLKGKSKKEFNATK